MSASGYFCLARGWLHHRAFKSAPLSEREAFAWIVEHAAWRDTPFNSNGRQITVKRGQLATSMRLLSDQWGSGEWSKSRVHRFLARLKSASLIGTEIGTGRIVITVNDYNDYQLTPGGRAGQVAGRAAGHERDTKEEGNKSSIEAAQKTAPTASLRQEAFRRAKTLLVGTLDERGKQITAERAGALVNGWLRDYGEAAVIQAVTKAEAAGAAFDGIAYMIGILKHTTGQRAFARSAPQASPKALVVGSPEWIERQRERGLPVSQGNAA